MVGRSGDNQFLLSITSVTDQSLRYGASRTSPSVIVIGGGLAGLTAAKALQNASFKVTLLESQDRIGGRIHTDYSFGFPVDLGASWLHGACAKNPMAPLISRLQLPMYRTSGDNSVLYDHDLESYALFDMNGHLVPPEVVTEVGEKFELILDKVRQLRSEIESDLSIKEAISIVTERQPDLRMEGLSQEVMQWYICRMECWFAADADSISVRFWEEEELLEGGHGLMVKGYAPVILALSQGLDIRLTHRVTKLRRQFNSVQVTTENGKTFKADAAIVTVPLGVLKSKVIKFEPKLPPWKEAAIEEISIAKENKIVLYFKDRFWPNVDFLGIVAATSYECGYFLNLHKATGHPVLVYMPAGRLASELEGVPDEDAVRFAVMQLKKVLPNASEPVQYIVSHWVADTNSLGSYSYCSVGKPPELYEALRVPVDNLFFAGEATSVNYPGTVHGTFSTGLMAAEDCRRLLVEQYSDHVLFQPVMAQEASTEMVPLQISRM